VDFNKFKCPVSLISLSKSKRAIIMKDSRFGGALKLSLWLAVILSGIALLPLAAQSLNETPANFKVAFIGDQGFGGRARAVLNLIKAEGAQLVLHQGDFDYQDDPAAWEAQINAILGPNFPYFASIGNHDENAWDGENGYQQVLIKRLTRIGVRWEGDLGVKSSLRYKGLFIILVGPDVKGTGHDIYIREKLRADSSVWSICSWHKNMRAMQVGGKSDEAGWGVYEEARKGGAIIATGHEHSYSRTHLLSDCINQTVASTSDTLVLTKDDSGTVSLDEGRSFVFVSGLGGNSIRDQERCLPATPPYGCKGEWAAIYASNQNASDGALFGIFNVNGVSNLATFYFKDVKGVVVDSFAVMSNVEALGSDVDDPALEIVSEYDLEQNFPNPFNPSTTIRFYLRKASYSKLTIVNLLGEHVRTLLEGEFRAGEHIAEWDGRDDDGVRAPSGAYLIRLEGKSQVLTKKLMLVK
jgi:hypothetical protein